MNIVRFFIHHGRTCLTALIPEHEAPASFQDVLTREEAEVRINSGKLGVVGGKPDVQRVTDVVDVHVDSDKLESWEQMKADPNLLTLAQQLISAGYVAGSHAERRQQAEMSKRR